MGNDEEPARSAQKLQKQPQWPVNIIKGDTPYGIVVTLKQIAQPSGIEMLVMLRVHASVAVWSGENQPSARIKMPGCGPQEFRK